jgi:hypothetical protein
MHTVSVERGILAFSFSSDCTFLPSTLGEAVNPIPESFNRFFLVS